MPETATVHTLSPDTLASLRADLADAASRPDFAPASSARACTCPILLVGESRTIHAATGEVLRTFASSDLPDSRLAVACGNRRETVCPACSRVYAADAFQLIASGLLGGKGVPPEVAANPRVFATFTAPSFGKVHLGPGKDGVARPCHRRRDGSGCNRWHKSDDPAIGTPLDPATYSYGGAVLWNASASALWARFTINLRRDLARIAGLTAKEFAEQAGVSYAKVAEYQKRGNIHFHAVIRLDGPHGPGSAAPAWATFDVLQDAIRTAASRSIVHTPDARHVPTMPVVFGEQLDLRPIRTGELAGSHLTDRAVAGYIAKYATKSADNSGALDRPVYCRGCSGTGLTAPCLTHGITHDTACLLTCTRCAGTGLALDLTDLPITDHIRTLIATAWKLGALPDLGALKLRRWAHMLGFRGHFLTKGRRYSTTFGLLREARREHARQEHRDYLAAFGLLDADTPTESETLVIGTWAYAGRAVNLSASALPSGAAR